MSNHVSRVIHPGEEIEYRGKPSWMAVLHRPVIWTVLLFWMMGQWGSSDDGDSNGLGVVLTVVILWTLYSIVRGVVFAMNAEYVVTNRRVIGKYGFIRQHSVDIFITQVSGTSLQQTALGRIFHYGNVRIDGSRSAQWLIAMKNPRGFDAAIHARRSASKVDMGTAAYTLDVRVLPDAAPVVQPPVHTSAAPPPPPPTPAAPAPPPPAPVATPSVPAAWRDDPTGRHEHRYWDGQAWTDHVSNAGVTSSDPV